MLAKVPLKQAPVNLTFTKHGHGLGWTEPVEGVLLEVLAVRVLLMVHHQAWPGMRLWGETDDDDDEVTSSSPCEVKIVIKKRKQKPVTLTSSRFKASFWSFSP